MKLPNRHSQISYGVANAASFWHKTKAGAYRKALEFRAFKNEREAAAGARRIIGGYVVRRVVSTDYEIDR